MVVVVHEGIAMKVVTPRFQIDGGSCIGLIITKAVPQKVLIGIRLRKVINIPEIN